MIFLVIILTPVILVGGGWLGLSVVRNKQRRNLERKLRLSRGEIEPGDLPSTKEAERRRKQKKKLRKRVHNRENEYVQHGYGGYRSNNGGYSTGGGGGVIRWRRFIDDIDMKRMRVVLPQAVENASENRSVRRVLES